MKKTVFFISLICLITAVFSITVAAAGEPDMSISIMSPQSVEGLPGLEQTIKVQVKNNTTKPIEDVMVYITMADLSKHMTVNLEDYGASTPVVVGILGANETTTLDLPVRLVYVSKFYLYTTVVTSTSPQIISSDAIIIQILGNTMIDKGIVQIISVVVPVIILIFVIVLLVIYKRRRLLN